MLSVGIVGLPNAGKSTLFNALVKGNQAAAANFPFCTIEPNVGLVEVPDERLAKLAAIVQPKQIVPAVVEFVDIAGLVAGAHKGEGLGNQFLGRIKETQAIVLVLRAFADPDVSHVYGEIDPVRDYETLLLELVMSDLATVSNIYDKAARAAHDGRKETGERAEIVRQIKEILERNQPLLESELYQKDHDGKIKAVINELSLLTAKPRLLVFNIGEKEMAAPQESPMIKEWLTRGQTVAADFAADRVLFISSKLEAELLNLPDAEQAEFLASYNLVEPSLHRLIQQAYTLLGLQSFFTAGPMEVRAWTIPVGATAPEAAGVIHTDFQERFIRAEVISYQDFIDRAGEAGARDAGRLRSEGKNYVVADGDVLHIRFAPV